MVGPPPDPRQLLAPVGLAEDPWAWLLCVALGLGLSALALWWRRPNRVSRVALLILGQVLLLTTPLAAHLDTFVYGAFPTIDKQGSLLFYLDGVHVRMLLHPLASLSDPAARLIGVHVGHLWVTALFDLFLTPWGAFNLQGLLYPALAWFTAWLLLRDLSGDDRVALPIAFTWGMGLHVFRDLNWYTIEKAAIFWLALYLWALHRAWLRGGPWPWIAGLLFGLMSWMNLYLGLVGAAVGGLALLVTAISSRWSPALRRVGLACLLSAVAAAPLVVWQIALMRSGPALASPEAFLWERAALDSFTLVPPAWDRLELWRALNPVVLGLAAWGAVRSWHDKRVRFALLAGGVLFLLALGPALLPGPVHNPLYFAVRALVPGFWRVAKPEVFFHATWLGLCAVAAIQLAASRPPRWLGGALYLLFVVGWVFLVRLHPAYPTMTLPVETALDPGWERRVFGEDAP